MFVRYRKLESGKTRVQIVECYRVNGKVIQKVLRHVGTAHNDAELEEMKKMSEYLKETIQAQVRPSLFSKEELEKAKAPSKAPSKLEQVKEELPTLVNLRYLREEKRIITGFHDVYGTLFDRVGYGSVLKSSGVSRRIFKDIVMARLAKPVSKRASCELPAENFGIEHDPVQVYRMMDALKSEKKNTKNEIIKIDKIPAIQKLTFDHTKRLLNDKITVFFYDCTTLYFESFTEDDLRRFGYSKDHKFNQGQIILALMVTDGGLPVGYDIFPGNMYEGNTFENAVNKLKKTYTVDEAVIVADSGLMSEDNIRIVKTSGFQYILGARLKNLSQTWQEKILSNTEYDDTQIIHYNDTAEKVKDVLNIKDYDYEHAKPKKKPKTKQERSETDEEKNESGIKERLIVSRSSARAEKDQHDREKAVKKLLDKFKKSKNPTDFISNFGYKKYIKAEGAGSVSLDDEKIAKASLWDGLHGVFTNTGRNEINAFNVLKEYHGLWQVEDSFRIDKHDLRMRPVFHWTPDRIKSHIAICFVAFSLIRFLQHEIKQDEKEEEKVGFSARRISLELNNVQESILYDVNDKSKKYVIPSKSSDNALKIYQAMKLHRSVIPYKMRE